MPRPRPPRSRPRETPSNSKAGKRKRQCPSLLSLVVPPAPSAAVPPGTSLLRTDGDRELEEREGAEEEAPSLSEEPKRDSPMVSKFPKSNNNIPGICLFFKTYIVHVLGEILPSPSSDLSSSSCMIRTLPPPGALSPPPLSSVPPFSE